MIVGEEQAPIIATIILAPNVQNAGKILFLWGVSFLLLSVHIETHEG